MNVIHWTMGMNQVLGRGDYLVGTWDNPFDNHCFLAMQGDGNLVLYRRKGWNLPFEAIWATGTDGTDASWCVLQLDGNLVLVNDQYVARWGAGVNRPLGVKAFLYLHEWADSEVHAYLDIVQDGDQVWKVGDSESLDLLTSRKQVLLTQLRFRYESVPRKVQQAVQRSKDAEQLTDWILRVITEKELAPNDLLHR